MVKKRSLGSFYKALVSEIRKNKISFCVYSALRLLVILVMVRAILLKNYEHAALCILSLVLFLVPAFVEKQFRIELPTALECIVLLFIFAAAILGEISSYYVRVPGWDTMLHTINGFLCAAIGFALVDLMNRNSRKINLSPLYLTIVAFCFSMTVGVLWEFGEYAMDKVFLIDGQKDFVITEFASVTLDPTKTNIPVPVKDITQTVITTADGQQIVIDGYLDIGNKDTMKDLWVNFLGALVFSIIGFFYVKNRNKKSFARFFVPTKAAEKDI